ncbi:MAG: 50S ribosomal protein L13 [Myxococcota bacterium]
MKTVSAKKEDIQRDWYVIDATNQTLGRLATRVATVLRGKHKPIFTPHVDTGDFVVVINAEKVKLTGKKNEDKLYHYHTGWVGGVVTRTAKQLREQRPERLIENAVHGMLPKNVLGRAMGKKLKVYAGGEHPHAAQKPRDLAL